MSDPHHPDDRRYHPGHDWASIDGNVATFGITWHAQHLLGDIVFFEPPEVGRDVRAGASYGELESVKTVSDLIAPLDGTIVEVNEGIADSPERVNEDPYGAWLVRVELADPDQVESLLTAEQYAEQISS